MTLTQKANKLKIVFILNLLLVLLITPNKTLANTFNISGGVLHSYKGSATEVVIPEGVKEIAPYAFSENSASIYESVILNITKITIPLSVTLIGQEAFAGLDSLQTVELKGTYDGKSRVIGPDAFAHNPNLRSIVIPGSISTVSDGAFSLCFNLQTIEIQEGVKEIGKEAFSYAKALTSVTLPESLTSINSSLFDDASTNFTITAPQYISNSSSSEPPLTEAAKLINTLANRQNNPISIPYTPTNYKVTKNTISGGTITINKIDGSGNILKGNVNVLEENDKIEIKVNIQTGYEIEKITYTINGTNETELSTTTEITQTGRIETGTLTMPDGDLKLNVELKQNKYEITAIAGSNGSISPSGTVEVIEGKSQSYTITPDTDYIIDKVIIDGEELATRPTTYTFSNVREPHTIEVTFKEIVKHSITATAGTGGSITPSGTVEVIEGQNKTFTITPSSGYVIDSLKIDNVEQVDKPTTYTFTNVSEPHTIAVTFRELQSYNLTTNISNIISTTIKKKETKNITISTGTGTSFLS